MVLRVFAHDSCYSYFDTETVRHAIQIDTVFTEARSCDVSGCGISPHQRAGLDVWGVRLLWHYRAECWKHLSPTRGMCLSQLYNAGKKGDLLWFIIVSCLLRMIRGVKFVFICYNSRDVILECDFFNWALISYMVSKLQVLLVLARWLMWLMCLIVDGSGTRQGGERARVDSNTGPPTDP